MISMSEPAVSTAHSGGVRRGITTPARLAFRISRVAWGLICVLLAVPGQVFATSLSDLAANMQPGEWKTLATNGFGSGSILTPPSGNGNILEYSDEVIWSPVKHEAYIYGCARPYGSSDQKWVKYVESTNSWASLPQPPASSSPHGYDHAAIDPVTGDYYYRASNADPEVWRYSANSDSWTRLPDMPVSGDAPAAGGIEFFPELGGAVFPNPYDNEYYLYKPSTNSWTVIARGGVAPLSYDYFTEYSAVHKILFIGGGEDNPDYSGHEGYVLLKMDSTGKVTRAANAPVLLGMGGANGVISIQVADPVSGNLLVFSVDGRTYEYDPVQDAWSQRGTHPLKLSGCSDMDSGAAAIRDYGVILGVASSCSGSNGQVFLYKHDASFGGTPPPSDTTAPAQPQNLRVQ